MGWPGPAWLSGYGLILGAKLSLLVVLFAIASWNRWVLTAPAVAGEPRAIRHMRRGIGAEIILILLIFGLVSGWRFTPPPRALAEVSETQSASLHLMGDDVEANVTVSPATVGTSRLSATLTGEGGEALGAKSVRFVLTPSSGEVAPTTRPAALTPAGTWEASDVVLPLAGLWTVQVEVRVTDFQLVKLHGEIEVAP
jgi:copper transport protein